MKPITIWYRLNENQVWEFNHIQDGHVAGEYPTPISQEFKSQVSGWTKGKWQSKFGHLTEANVVVTDEGIL